MNFSPLVFVILSLYFVPNIHKDTIYRHEGHKRQMQITHNDIDRFADDVVNLPPEHARKYRSQVDDLSQKLEAHIEDNPNYHFKRVMLSGSLAKRTSLRNISDADMALYLESDDAPENMTEFLEWLEKELETLYKHIDKNDIEAKTYSVSISFGSKGLDIDIVPIYWHNKNWDGDLVSQHDGSLLSTNIPQHLDFMKKRHMNNPSDFRQVIRLIKYWANEQKEATVGFRFKSFMVELIVAHLADKGHLPLGNYPEALRAFFDYLQMSNLDDVISFNDFGHGSVNKQNKPINIFDPVNAQNNVAESYTQKNKDLILDAAMNAADAIDYASCATTKAEALRQWRKVFGTSFSA